MTAATIGPLFAALADDTRRTVLDAVGRRGTATATELTEVVPVSRQAIAKHLTVLHDAGVVRCAQVGRETRYEVVPGALRPVSAWVSSTESAWNDRLARLGSHLARRRS